MACIQPTTENELNLVSILGTTKMYRTIGYRVNNMIGELAY